MSEQGKKDWSGEFPILREMVFLNHAGVSPISGRAAGAVRAFAEQAERRAYVGAGWYAKVREVKRLAARLIGAGGEEGGEEGSEEEIALVANTSTGISLVAKGLEWRAGDRVVITDVEYPANRYPWEDLKRFGVEVVEVRQRKDGRIPAGDVAEAVTDRTRVVAVSHVQYASGYRMDLRPIGEVVHRAGGYLCVDGIQSVGAMPVDVRELGIDFLSADGHKWMLGPEGCGIFYCRKELIGGLHPNVVGWMNMVNASDYGSYEFRFLEDARRFEAGSYNVVGAMGLGASLELLLGVGMERVWVRIEMLTDRLCEGLARKGYRVFSPRGAGEKSGIVVFEPGERAGGGLAGMQKMVADMERAGIVIVVREGRLRASPHFYNTEEQVDRLVGGLPG